MAEANQSAVHWNSDRLKNRNTRKIHRNTHNTNECEAYIWGYRFLKVY